MPLPTPLPPFNDSRFWIENLSGRSYPFELDAMTAVQRAYAGPIRKLIEAHPGEDIFAVAWGLVPEAAQKYVATYPQPPYADPDSESPFRLVVPGAELFHPGLQPETPTEGTAAGLTFWWTAVPRAFRPTHYRISGTAHLRRKAEFSKYEQIALTTGPAVAESAGEGAYFWFTPGYGIHTAVDDPHGKDYLDLGWDPLDQKPTARHVIIRCLRDKPVILDRIELVRVKEGKVSLLDLPDVSGKELSKGGQLVFRVRSDTSVVDATVEAVFRNDSALSIVVATPPPFL